MADLKQLREEVQSRIDAEVAARRKEADARVQELEVAAVQACQP